MHTLHNVKNRQRGAILVMSLLILLALTLVGINSLNGSIMEEKMVSNSQIATTTFQTAESSIRAAHLEELNDPFRAVEKNRVSIILDRSNISGNRDNSISDYRNDSIADHRNGGASGMSSSSQHRFNPTVAAVNSPNSSNSLEARPFEIIGTAQIGAIQSTHIQGFRVLNVMRQP